jgi:hypothetical protein
MSTRTILHDVRVFAVDTQFERQHGNGELAPAAKTVALLVSPEQAVKLALATGMGTIRLVMRSPDDSEHSDSAGASAGDLLGESRGDGQSGGGLNSATPAQPPTIATNSASSSGSASAPAPLPMSATPSKSPATWTMVLLEGSEMRDVVLSADKFPVITSDHVDYAPDPPPLPVGPPPPPADATDTSANDPPLRQPTAGDDGFGSPTEVPND